MARKPYKKRKDVKAAANKTVKRSKGEAVLDPIGSAEADTHTLKDASEGGRPSKYRPEFARQAKLLCQRGATDAEIAEFLGVTTVTVWRWRSEYAEFCNACIIGKDECDARVERSLYQRAVGYSYHTEKIFAFQGDITRAQTVEHVPPDTGAALKWLSSRKPDKWREVSRQEISGPDGAAIKMESPVDEIISRIARLAERAAKGGSPARSD